MPSAAASRYPQLHSPVSIGSLPLPHRLLMGSMHLNSETADDGGRAMAAFYAERVRGGAGLIITGGAAVSRIGAGSASYAVINDPAHWSRYQRVVDAVHNVGGLIALQLFHAGRYARDVPDGSNPLAPSAVYSAFSRRRPEAMSAAQIANAIAEFAAGAERAIALGFDAVEVMGSEGYLINEFASPVTNLRDDEWGGDAARRRSFPVAVVMAVRQAIDAAPLIMRMSGADLVPGSSSPAEIDALAIALVEAGVDALDVGIGWHESRVPTVQSLVPHAMWVEVAARIRNSLIAVDAHRPVIAANRINSVEQAEQVLATGRVDLVSMARPFLADPDIVRKSFFDTTRLVNTCIGCNEACIDRSFGAEPVSCLVNPRAGRELEFPAMRRWRDDDAAASGAGASIAAGTPEGFAPSNVAVIGAGPAGMEAARALAANGAQVTVFERAERIGGQFLMAGMVPGKIDFLETIRYFENELPRLGVRIRLSALLEAHNTITQLSGFDHVVVATGVRPRQVPLPGTHLPHVIDYQAAFRCPDAIGPRVAVIGAGGIAVDLAHLLVEVAKGSRLGHPASINERMSRQLFLHNNQLAAETMQPTLPGTASGAPGAPDAPDAREGSSRTVTIMRRNGAIGSGMGISTRWAVVQAIRQAGVRTLTGVSYDSITPDGVWIGYAGHRELIEADTVVIAAGQEPNPEFASILESAGIRHTLIGGALRATGMNAVTAFEQGLRVGTALATRAEFPTNHLT